MNRIEINTDNYLEYRDTPWDARAFGFKTNELLEIKFESIRNLQFLIDEYIRYTKENNIKFCYTRIPSDEIQLRKVLQEKGFYYAETSYYLSKIITKRDNFGRIFKNDLIIAPPVDDDFEAIRNIARDAFNFSRFHEDCNIDIAKARDRYYNWVDDLRNQGKHFLAYKINQELISFLAYNTSEKELDLILAGTVAGKGMISFNFWASFMTYFQNQGYSRAKTVISASNIGIVNLYSRLDFKFDKLMLGFHKFNE
jgi:hypothetical protein